MLVPKSICMMNYFEPKSAAERYALGRPYFHPQVIEQIKAHLALSDPLPSALDLGCGTGLSTIALKAIAERIVGADYSANMIACAPRDPHIAYLVSPAEKLPLKAAIFDLITVSSALHWLDHAAFFAEAQRVLRSQAWLIVYDNYFSGKMDENTAYQSWSQEYFLKKYPVPPRARFDLAEADLKEAGFHLACREEYQNRVEFSLATLVDYLVTQSNIIAAVEGGNQKIEDVRQWIAEGIRPFFGAQPEATFLFGGSIWYLRRITP